MARNLAELLEVFVRPLLGGGELRVGAPLGNRERETLMDQTGELADPELRFLRMRRAQLLVANPSLPDPDVEELTLWIGLHNTLVFDHPDRRRVWSRAAAWRRVEGVTRSCLTLPMPTTPSEALVRHLSVGAFLELVRRDLLITTPVGELRVMGQDPPRRSMRLSSGEGIRQEVVTWSEQVHTAESQRLLEDALRASPLTCVLRPVLAPPGWSPLWAGEAFCDRGMVRAICHAWARQRDWVAVGGAVAGALLPSLPDPDVRALARNAASTSTDRVDTADGDDPPRRRAPRALPGAVLPRDPAVLAGIVGALIHLHFLKVLELDARLGVAAVSRDPGVTAFLALPLLLPALIETLGEPLGDTQDVLAQPAGRTHVDAPIARRWTEYLDHLQELVPKAAVDNLLASLTPRIVQTS